MRMNPYCMCCQINKQEHNIRQFDDPEKKVKYMQEILALMANAGPEACSPSLAIDIKKIYAAYWSIEDDYTQIKHDFNQLMLGLEDRLEEAIRKSSDPLETALLYARIGNYIDFAAMENVEKNVVLSMMEEENKEPLDPIEYKNFRDELSRAKTLLYLTDNCGEIVLDKLAIKILKEQYPHLDLTVMVRGLPVVNDATMEDAEEAGLTEIAKVVGNGDGTGGTWFPGISQEAKELLYNADVILAKGQGNFETMNECGLNIYYLFLCKCDYFQKIFRAKPFQGMFVNERRAFPER